MWRVSVTRSSSGVRIVWEERPWRVSQRKCCLSFLLQEQAVRGLMEVCPSLGGPPDGAPCTLGTVCLECGFVGMSPVQSQLPTSAFNATGTLPWCLHNLQERSHIAQSDSWSGVWLGAHQLCLPPSSPNAGSAPSQIYASFPVLHPLPQRSPLPLLGEPFPQNAAQTRLLGEASFRFPQSKPYLPPCSGASSGSRCAFWEWAISLVFHVATPSGEAPGKCQCLIVEWILHSHWPLQKGVA